MKRESSEAAPGVANMLAKSLAPTMTPVSALDTPSRVQNVPTVGTASMQLACMQRAHFRLAILEYNADQKVMHAMQNPAAKLNPR